MLTTVPVMLLAMTLVPLGDTAGKLMTAAGVAPVFVASSRLGLGALILLPVKGALNRAPYSDPRVWLRAFLFAAVIVSIVTSQRTEPIANTFAALFTGPLLSYVLAVVFLGERVTMARTVLLVLGFVGVLLVVRPGSDMSPGILYAVMAGVFYGGYLTMNRWLAGAYPGTSLLMSQLVIGVILTTPLAITRLPDLDPYIARLALLSAAASALGNLLLIWCYGRAEATLLAPLVYFQLVAATFFGWSVFGNWPDLVALAGFLLLIGAGVAGFLLRPHHNRTLR